MSDDTIAILTLPHNNQVSLIYTETNNLITLTVICFQILLLVSLCIISFLIPHFYKNLPTSIKSSHLDSISIVMCSYIFVWLVLLLSKIYLKKCHYRRLQKIGYHNHYQKVYWLSNVPHSLYSFSAVCILCVMVFFNKKQEDSSSITLYSLDLINCLQIVITFFAAMCCPSLAAQLYFELVFRKEQKPPDVFYLDDPHHLTQAGLGNIGLRSSTFLEDLFEKQAELINNLKIHNNYLRQTLYRLSERQSSMDIINE